MAEGRVASGQQQDAPLREVGGDHLHAGERTAAAQPFTLLGRLIVELLPPATQVRRGVGELAVALQPGCRRLGDALPHHLRGRQPGAPCHYLVQYRRHPLRLQVGPQIEPVFAGGVPLGPDGLGNAGQMLDLVHPRPRRLDGGHVVLQVGDGETPVALRPL